MHTTAVWCAFEFDLILEGGKRRKNCALIVTTSDSSDYIAQEVGIPQSEEFGNALAILDCVKCPFFRPIHMQLTPSPNSSDTYT
jgi:hypothetical protein